ncbi:immunoglobulin superfamily member 1-like [Malaclemys terrapin pileata]|uniref:immunoglobulin superfamily member 1-like n=1 Tax=Malaclemys terrapin pileata TaxID=2991368 RepID=UPI0023A876DD|nr:immunoglobulin superfamily member 1-like [Malaclemys terrapin pileata]
MASALTVLLLGSWLSGHSGVWGEPSYPKPSISLSPSGGVSLGGAVSVWCRGQHRGMRFVLNKERRHFPPVDSDDNEAVFPISNVRREDGGNYSCSYHSRSKPFAVSYPSDPMELVVRDPNLPRPSIALSPTGVTAPGADVTIRCQGQRWDVRFFLHKAGDLNPQRHMDTAGDGAEFRIPTVGRQHGGNYSCSYRPQSEPFISSYPSSYVELLVAEPSYPKPSISLSPSGGVSLGESVAIWCQGQRRDMRFVLNKERRHFLSVDSDGFEAVFPISNVSREDGGSYSCSYHSRSEPFAVSYPSDPMELVVRDPRLPRPSISLSPIWVTAPGADATIPCQGQHRDVRFFLHKAGDLNPPRHMDPPGNRAEFRIPTVGRQHGGNYSCSYRNRSEPFISSEPSDPVQLVGAAVIPEPPNVPSWWVQLTKVSEKFRQRHENLDE